MFAAVGAFWMWAGNSVWSDTQDFCHDLRGTDQWSEQNCSAIDPGGSSRASSTTP